MDNSLYEIKAQNGKVLIPEAPDGFAVWSFAYFGGVKNICFFVDDLLLFVILGDDL